MPASQWVEIVDDSDQGVPPSGFTLTDHGGTGSSNISLPAVTLPPGALLVAHLAAGSPDFDFSDGAVHFYTGSPVPVYDTEDQVALCASAAQSASTPVDLVAWDNDPARGAAAGLRVAGKAVGTAAMDPAQSLGRGGDSLRIGTAADREISGGRDASDGCGESDLGAATGGASRPNTVACP